MEMAIFPVNRKVAQEAWRRTLTVRPWSSSYGMLMICANVFCVSAFATLGRYAYLKKAGVESISFSMAAGLLFLLLGGAFMFRLYRGVRRLLAESEGEKYFEDFLSLSYLGLRLYLLLLFGMGVVAMLVPGFMQF